MAQKNEQQQNSNIMENALALASRGLKVFPVHSIRNDKCTCGNQQCHSPGKHPKNRNGFKDATSDETSIRQFCQSMDCNIGLRTGLEAGFFVLDVDGVEGLETLKRLEEESGELIPITPSVITGGGGRHFYFKIPDGMIIKNRTKIAPKIDIRGDGGYVVAPGSKHISGREYTYLPGLSFEDVPLAYPPEFILALLRTDKTDRTSQCVSTGKVAEGARNDVLFRKACSMAHTGFAREAVLAAIKAENLKQCNPPLSEEEINQIVNSSFKYQDTENIDWQPVRDLPSLEAEVPEMTADLLPPFFREYAVDASERMQVPLELIAIPLIGAFSGVVGNRFVVLPKRIDDWRIAPNLWALVVAPPSCLKSPSLKVALAPVHYLEEIAKRLYEFQKKRFDIESIVLKEIIANEKKALQSVLRENSDTGASQHLGIIAANESLLRSMEPKRIRFITSDATTEKLGEILQFNKHGLIVFRDELYGLLSLMEQKGRENDRTFYLESWSGESQYTVDRIGRGTVEVPKLCLTLIGGIQPDRLSVYFDDVLKTGSADDGFLIRFQLLVSPNFSMSWQLVDRQPDRVAERNVFRIFKWIVKLGGNQSASISKKIHFDTEAQEFFNNWLGVLEARLRSGEIKSPVFQSYLGKQRSLLPSLALLFCLIEKIGSTASIENIRQIQISLSQVQLAKRWCDFLEAHARKIYAASINPQLRAAHELRKKILNGQITDRTTIRDIYRNNWSFLNTHDSVKSGLEILTRCGWVHIAVQKNHNGGPSTEIVRVNSSILARRNDISPGVGL